MDYLSKIKNGWENEGKYKNWGGGGYSFEKRSADWEIDAREGGANFNDRCFSSARMRSALRRWPSGEGSTHLSEIP